MVDVPVRNNNNNNNNNNIIIIIIIIISYSNTSIEERPTYKHTVHKIINDIYKERESYRKLNTSGENCNCPERDLNPRPPVH